MRRFIVHTIGFLSPFIIAIVVYIIADPLRIIWEYEDYAKTPSINAGYTSYKLLTKGDTIRYNSFIVGSSRSQNWSWEAWESHLNSTAKAFHLNHAADGMYRALERLQYVYRNVEKVENVLLIIDYQWLIETEFHSDFTRRNPWQMRQPEDFWDFQIAALKYFFSIDGLKQYFQVGEEYDNVLAMYRDERGEPHYVGKEQMIAEDPEYYYTHMVPKDDPIYSFYERDSVERVEVPIITKKGEELLRQMKRLFAEGGTDYKMVISPLYNQVRLNPMDKAILDSIFGSENVYDYSGINKYTNDVHNYYEASHYRPCVAKQIMEEIYR